MTDILDLPDWTLLAKRAVGDEYELEAEYRLLPGACIKCGSVGRLYKHGICCKCEHCRLVVDYDRARAKWGGES